MQISAKELAGRLIMRVMLFTAVFSAMSMLTFNIVLPELRAEFRIDLAQASWLSSGYLLVYAIGSVVYGKLANRYRLKNLITFGLLVFAVGSLVGFASSAFWQALAGRLLQAAGASVVPAAAMLIPIRYFPRERRGVAMSMTAAGLALGTALGPVVAALMLSALDWRWLFVPPIFVLALVPFFRKYVNDVPDPNPGKLDRLGGALLAATIAFALLGATYMSWQLFAAAALMLGMLAWRLATASEPFVQPALLRNRKYAGGLCIAALIACVASGMALLPPVLLADVYGLESEWIGFALVPAAVASSALSRSGGKLADRRGDASLYTLASGLLMLCFALLAAFSGAAPAWTLTLFLVFGNVGQTFIQVAVASSLSKTLSNDQAGVGMGLVQMTNGIASAMAASLYGLLLELDAPGWIPLAAGTNARMYVLLFASFILVHAGLLAYYRMRFRPDQKTKSASTVEGR
ncbi:MFS transporter [Paenibacillus methanolicus]|uniref:DHA2 family metal-tetracycline-proton antiporter-like MFS transporter n=1 Tax=Paenibacillus methanolicus TaxID=582686 RepID=A0A5S5CJW9_9BACL|nr:MFS transporter [Paenibacillus methanolicus]TYP79303.1 DHA2 family metal-tetracycline-proton antiporter-like MFS transporter [Paenibacillus methanolicus]